MRGHLHHHFNDASKAFEKNSASFHDLKETLNNQEEENFLMEYMKNPVVIQSLDQEDPLEKRTATHSSILAWRIPWTEEPGRLQSMELQRVRHS